MNIKKKAIRALMGLQLLSQEGQQPIWSVEALVHGARDQLVEVHQENVLIVYSDS